MANANTTTATATYKGKKYRLLWAGQTKFGRRAHLQFMDGGKDFWVDEALVTADAAAAAPRARTARCACSDPGCECHTGRCRCERHCNCRGGNIYDC